MKVAAAIILTISICATTPARSQNKTTLYLQTLNDAVLQRKIEKNISAALTQINVLHDTNPDANTLVANTFDYTAEWKNAITELWNTAPFFCPNIRISSKLILHPNGGYEVRGIDLVVSEGAVRHREEGVIRLTPDGALDGLSFGIHSGLYHEVLANEEDVLDFRRRQVLVDFLENFRTAYNRKDIDFLQKVYSENALIIVGKVLKVQEASDDGLVPSIPPEQVELIRLSKQQYLSSLQEVFRQNEFIKIFFENVTLFQHPKFEDIYGITLLQRWTSTSYTDAGYLFILIEFREDLHPLVHVRTWQPEKFTTRKQVIQIGDFEIVR